MSICSYKTVKTEALGKIQWIQYDLEFAPIWTPFQLCQPHVAFVLFEFLTFDSFFNLFLLAIYWLSIQKIDWLQRRHCCIHGLQLQQKRRQSRIIRNIRKPLRSTIQKENPPLAFQPKIPICNIMMISLVYKFHLLFMC